MCFFSGTPLIITKFLKQLRKSINAIGIDYKYFEKYFEKNFKYLCSHGNQP